MASAGGIGFPKWEDGRRKSASRAQKEVITRVITKARKGAFGDATENENLADLVRRWDTKKRGGSGAGPCSGR